MSIFTLFSKSQILKRNTIDRGRRKKKLCQIDTVFLFKNWLFENNVKIDFPIYLSHFPLKFAFLRNVKIDFRIV